MPTLEIDGQSVTVDDGANLIEAAAQLGIEIPHYCYHPGLTRRGQLPHVSRRDREDAEAADRLQHARHRGHGRHAPSRTRCCRRARRCSSSCSSITRSTARSATRPASASCRTTTWTTTARRAASRSSRRSKRARRSTSVRLIMLDQERCILCTRCTRFLDEVTGTSELGVFRARRPLPDRRLSGRGARQPLFRQRRRHLSGRGPDQQGLPFPRPGLVPREHPVGLRRAVPPAATSTSTIDATRSFAFGRASTPTSTATGCATRGG